MVETGVKARRATQRSSSPGKASLLHRAAVMSSDHPRLLYGDAFDPAPGAQKPETSDAALRSSATGALQSPNSLQLINGPEPTDPFLPCSSAPH